MEAAAAREGPPVEGAAITMTSTRPLLRDTIRGTERPTGKSFPTAEEGEEGRAARAERGRAKRQQQQR